MLRRLADQVAIGGSIGRALALVAGFVVVFLFLPRSDDRVVGTDRAVGTVEISPDRPLAATAQQWFAEVRLSDGRHVKVVFPAPQPRDGDAAALVVEHYASGGSRYFLDAEAWKARQ
jgi:hypothetical protein